MALLVKDLHAPGRARKSRLLRCLEDAGSLTGLNPHSPVRRVAQMSYSPVNIEKSARGGTRGRGSLHGQGGACVAVRLVDARVWPSSAAGEL